jgi:hypothetical protein
VQPLFIAILLWPAKKSRGAQHEADGASWKRFTKRWRGNDIGQSGEVAWLWRWHWRMGEVGRDYIRAELQALDYPSPESLKDLHLPHDFILTTEVKRAKTFVEGRQNRD